MNISFEINSENLPGVKGTSQFKINSYGIRGEEPKTEAKLKIIAFGGSTTEDAYLDSNESWCGVLEDRLEASGIVPVWVGNAGKSGMSSRDIFLHVKYALPGLPKPDIVMLMVGVNDLLQRLQEDQKWEFTDIENIDFHEARFNRAFFGLPWNIKPKRWASISLITTMINNVFYKEYDPKNAGQELEKWRKWRNSSLPHIKSLPDMSDTIFEYKRNINLILDHLLIRKINVFLITQPTLWSSDLTNQQKELLWMGGVGNYQNKQTATYYSAEALRNGLNLFNNALLEVCKERSAECVDLQLMLQKGSNFYFDGIHFNEAGAFETGNKLAKEIIQYIETTNQ